MQHEILPNLGSSLFYSLLEARYRLKFSLEELFNRNSETFPFLQMRFKCCMPRYLSNPLVLFSIQSSLVNACHRLNIERQCMGSLS